ncbi:MAG: metallophosphatase family protein [Gammaproteobacteria bacterium]|nr:metallophosphatase family protein [Gammaproteobacteria bacterium]MDH5735350.1 metallophosphatase family protein [Gammaproteobacteria bacterium]
MSSPNPSTIRIAIISDTHGIIDNNIIDVIKRCDQVIHAGDICGAHVLEQLHSISNQVTAVAGNNDASGLWPVEETHVVTALPHIAEIRLPGGSLVMEHGHRHGMQKPCHDSLRKTHAHARVIVYGHTHSMLVDKDKIPWVINPGAAGKTRTRGGSSCLILTINDDTWDVEMLRFADENTAVA